MKLTNFAKFCCTLVLPLFISMPGTSNATYLSNINQTQHVSSYSAGSFTYTKDSYAAGNSIISAETSANDERKDYYGNFAGWISSNAYQSANTTFNKNNGKFTLDLLLSGGDSSVVNPFFSNARLTAQAYSEYTLNFHINSDTKYSIEYSLEGFGANALTYLVNQNTGNYIFYGPFPYNYFSDIYGDNPYSGRLVAGNYELYLMADTGLNSCGENGTSFDSIISAHFIIDATSVPEPSTFILFGAGLAGVFIFKFRNRKTGKSR